MNKPVVLVVDDEVDARNTIIDFLEARYDCKYREAKDGEEAVHFVKSNPCDVMILDIKMPKKGGIAVVCTQLKLSRLNRGQTPIYPSARRAGKGSQRLSL